MADHSQSSLVLQLCSNMVLSRVVLEVCSRLEARGIDFELILV
jgi:hypothetical protein